MQRGFLILLERASPDAHLSWDENEKYHESEMVGSCHHLLGFKTKVRQSLCCVRQAFQLDHEPRTIGIYGLVLDPKSLSTITD